jgi:WD40 repeat protein
MLAAGAAAGGAAGAQKQGRADLHGDPLPEGAVARLGTIRLRHLGMIRAVAFCPDGNTVVSAGGNWNQPDAIRFWDPITGRQVRSLKGHERGTWSIALSGDGKLMLSTGQDQTIRLWDVVAGKEIAQIRNNEGGMPFVAFSPDGKTFAAGNGQMVRVWETDGGKKIRDLGPGGPVAFSRDGNSLATVNIYVMGNKPQGAIQVYDVQTGKVLRSFGDVSKERFQSLAWSAAGDVLAAGGFLMQKGQGAIALFDVSAGKELRRCGGSQGAGQNMVTSLSFSPDGKTLAGACYDVVARLWDVSSGKELRTLRVGGPVRASQLGAHYSQTTSVAFSPDGNMLVSGGVDGVVRLWNAATGQEMFQDVGHSGSVTAMAFARDGRTVVTGGQDRAVRVWEAATGKQVLAMTRHEAGVAALACTEDGKTVASAGSDGALRLWNGLTGQEILSVEKRSSVTRCLRFQEDPPGRAGPPSRGTLPADANARSGPKLLWASYDGETGMLDPDTGKEQRRRRDQVIPTGMLSAAFSNDGRMLVTGEYNGLCLWSIASGDRPIGIPAGQQCRGVGFSPHDDLVAWATGDVFGLVEVDSGREVLRMSTSRKRWNLGGDIAFFPHGRAVAVGGDEGEIDLYDVVQGRQLGKLQGHGAAIHCLEFSGDGRLLASSSADTTALVWDVRKYLDRKLPATATSPSGEAIEGLWTDLAGDAGKAYQASWLLVSEDLAPQAVAFFKERLKPISAAPSDRVKRLIADLNSPRYAVRTKAYDELSRFGSLAEPALREAAKTAETEEARTRLAKLLEAMRETLLSSPELLRQARAIRILERIGSDGAKALIQELSRGAPSARTTRQARAALERMALRDKSK